VMTAPGQVRSGSLIGWNGRYFWIGIPEDIWVIPYGKTLDREGAAGPSVRDDGRR
jgi:hypothetical protein